MKTVILDFDDLCDTNDPVDALDMLKERDPGFKVTLFAIPTRCGEALLAKYAARSEWIALGVHGWRHARHECLGWTAEETQDKLARSLEFFPGFQKVFKAPNWELDLEVYKGCKAAGFAVADHIRNIEILPSGQPHYIYNIRLRNDRFQRMHGHIQPWAGTGLTEGAVNGSGINPAYLLPVGTPYGFCAEAVAYDKAVAV
jgi:polysaccharide deacetylase